MKPVITAFKDLPDLGRGQARDMRVRWALEEVGRDYDVRLLSMTELKEAPHRYIPAVRVDSPPMKMASSPCSRQAPSFFTLPRPTVDFCPVTQIRGRGR